jgi:allophanate hydrolase
LCAVAAAPLGWHGDCLFRHRCETGEFAIAATAKRGSLDFAALRALYRRRPGAVVETVDAVYARIAADGDPALWIATVPREATLARARELASLPEDARAKLPLYGIPFALKDNIDAAGMPTTAACPAFAYTPVANSNVAGRLVAAGAILIGKTNLDQFATGLVGVRSPYGTPRNAFDSAYAPGGSSSGSATAVAKGLVSFSLGTDTAGSGRVPAAFNNIVGLKPTRGAIGTSGVVPACRSLDCVSIFALTVADAAEVLAVSAGDDAGDPFGRAAPAGWSPLPHAARTPFRFGVPREDQLRFFGNEETPALFRAAVARLRRLGGAVVEIDYAPFAAAAALLYQGPWVAERYAAVGAFIERNPNAVHPVTRAIIAGANKHSAAETFAALYKLEALKRETAPVWRAIDALLLPTAGTIYPVDAIERDPMTLNSNLGYYTNFVNLLDLAAIAVPAGFQANGLPFGVTLIAPAWHEGRLAAWSDALHRTQRLPLGATQAKLPAPAPAGKAAPFPAVPILVVGAHMEGLPLNGQLRALGARLAAKVKTAPKYRFYDLGGTPARPGLVRVANGARGGAIAGEVYDIPADALGAFLAQIPPPLGIGSVELEDGRWVKGFLCEAYAATGTKDITKTGGWRAYVAEAKSRPKRRKR